jgi:FAD dependent oxidoreductase
MDSISYWQRTSNQLPFSADLPPTADVAVVGAGLLGAATSYWLARAGLAVVLLERAAPAYGATGRNGGIVSAGLSPYCRPCARYAWRLGRRWLLWARYAVWHAFRPAHVRSSYKRCGTGHPCVSSPTPPNAHTSVGRECLLVMRWYCDM